MRPVLLVLGRRGLLWARRKYVDGGCMPPPPSDGTPSHLPTRGTRARGRACGDRVVAERLVDSIHASGGRVLTRAKVNKILIEKGRAEGVSVSRVGGGVGVGGGGGGGGGGAPGAAGGPCEVRVREDGSVISAIGILDTFGELVPLVEPAPSAAAEGKAAANREKGRARGGEAVEGTGARDARGGRVEAKPKAGAVGGDGGDGEERLYEPAGLRMLRAARPRVHLCVGLQGNWLEDLDATAAYVHHVRPRREPRSGLCFCVRSRPPCGRRVGQRAPFRGRLSED